MVIKCQKCGKERVASLSKVNIETYKKQYPVCRKCGFNKLSSKGWFKKGIKPWNIGKNGDYLPHWKGNNVGLDALHEWVERKLGKPRKCEKCGTITAKKYDWSNKNHQYKRILSDWQRLCFRCHFLYDKKKFGTRKDFHK